MKKLLILGAVAVLAAATARPASAQNCPPQCQRGGEVTFTTGVTFGLHWTPCHGHWVPNCPPPCYGYPPPNGYAGQLPAAQPGPGGPGLPPPPPAPPKGPKSDVQGVGYNYPVAYDPYYGYNYGVPYYQDPGYWYGYGYGQ